MLTTLEPNPPADRGRRAPTRDLLRAAWHRGRSWLEEASAFFALMLLAIAACQAPSASATTAPCPGSVSLLWAITDPTGQPLTCADASATSVALRLQSRTGGAPVLTAMPCAPTPGTVNVPPGLYDVAVELHDANGARLAVAPVQTSVAVAVGRTQALAPTRFVVRRSGGGGGSGSGSGSNGGGDLPGPIRLSLQAQGVTSNCQPASAGGAELSSMSISLTGPAGQCMPALLHRNRNGVMIGDYPVDCASPAVTTCIENDEALTSTNLPDGTYAIHVRARGGAGNCFAGDAFITVPLTGQLQQQIGLHPQSGC